MILRNIDITRPQGQEKSVLLRTQPGCDIQQLALQYVLLHHVKELEGDGIRELVRA